MRAWHAVFLAPAAILLYFYAWGQGSTGVIVRIEPGDTARVVATRLETSGAIRDRRAFLAWLFITGNQNSIKVGEYEIPRGASLNTIKNIVASGRLFMRFVTIPEGLSSMQIMDIVDRIDGLRGEITLSFKDGELLPQTYAYDMTTTRDGLLTRMKVAMDNALAEEWDKRADGLPYANMREALIMASIVEKETGVDAERPLVASVFVNRLRRRMRLQSDTTVAYTHGRPDGRLFYVDLRKDTPYNTYTRHGLPPGPICNPGRASIRAASQPARTEYLFFVADGTGGHRFSKTHAEHEKNRVHWRSVRGW